MTPTKTWTALMLAASTLALASLPAAAQEATTEGDAATSDLAAEGTADATLEGGATGDAAAETEMAADEGTTDTTLTAEGATGTEVAADEAAPEEGDATLAAEGEATDTGTGTGTDATVTAEGETSDDAGEETDLAAEDGTADTDADATVTAEEGTADLEGDATVRAEESATGDLTGQETDLAAEEDALDTTVTADGEAETQVVEGQADSEGGTVIQGTTPEDGTDLAVDDAATTGDGTELAADDAATADATADDTMTAEGEAAEGAEAMQSEGTTADAGTDSQGDAMMANAGEVASPPDQPNADMQAVLDRLAELGAQPISELSVEEARTQPTPADAVMAVMEERGIEMPADLAGILTRDITYPGADGSQIAARVYTPPQGEGPFPLIVYYHGGGWVIAGIDVYDASARALAAGANAVVVSATYRQAPEATFPAQHEDANAAYEWIVENSGEFNADAERLAVAGESAGGNLAINVAIHARDAQLIQPDHVLSVYPIASDDMELPSYEAYADAAPLSRDGMMWFFDHVFEDASQAADPRIDLIERDDLAGLPPVTIVNAEIDPLQSEGEILAARLMEAGVPVQQMTYPGVAHEFFGMGTVVPEAQEAMDFATAALRAAFEGTAPAMAGAEADEVTDVEATAAETPDAMTAEDGETAAQDN